MALKEGNDDNFFKLPKQEMKELGYFLQTHSVSKKNFFEKKLFCLELYWADRKPQYNSLDAIYITAFISTIDHLFITWISTIAMRSMLNNK